MLLIYTYRPAHEGSCALSTPARYLLLSVNLSMSYQTPNHEFWRSKYARQCIRNFQAQQKNAYILLPPGGGPLGSGPHVPPDRPPLTPIHSPAPIFTRPGGAPQDSPTPSDLLVCIVGAGVAGLYTALILEDLGIKYEILEGSSRPGGRVYTHHFQSPSIKPWSYFVSLVRIFYLQLR